MSDPTYYGCPGTPGDPATIWKRIDELRDQAAAMRERLARAEQNAENMDARLDRQEQMILRGQQLQQEQYGELISLVRGLSAKAEKNEGATDQWDLDRQITLKRISIVLTVLALFATLGWIGGKGASAAQAASEGANPLPEPPRHLEQPAIIKEPKRRVRSENQ